MHFEVQKNLQYGAFQREWVKQLSDNDSLDAYFCLLLSNYNQLNIYRQQFTARFPINVRKNEINKLISF